MNLILPIFVIEGENQRQEVKTMPGVFRQSIDQLVLTAKEAEKKDKKAEEKEEVAEEPNAKKYEKYENRLMDALRRCVRPFKMDELSQSVIKEQTRCPPTASSDDQTASQINAIEITVAGADGKQIDTKTVPIKK